MSPIAIQVLIRDFRKTLVFNTARHHREKDELKTTHIHTEYLVGFHDCRMAQYLRPTCTKDKKSLCKRSIQEFMIKLTIQHFNSIGVGGISSSTLEAVIFDPFVNSKSAICNGVGTSQQYTHTLTYTRIL